MHGHRRIRNADLKHITNNSKKSKDQDGIVSRNYETDNSDLDQD